jgi:hypothetical protein
MSPNSSHRRSPTRDLSSRRSSRRNLSSRRSSRRDRHEVSHQQYLPTIRPNSVFYGQTQSSIPTQYASSVRLPLLRLGFGVSMPGPAQIPLQPPPILAVPFYSARPVVPNYSSLYRMPIPHVPPQLSPPTSLPAYAAHHDQQKPFHVQNMAASSTDNHRPRLQLLQLRSNPSKNTAIPDLVVPMPAPNIVTTSTETKSNAATQVDVPRKDGFILEPDMFQVSFSMS